MNRSLKKPIPLRPIWPWLPGVTTTVLIYSAEFFYKQSSEEREHMLKIFRFINENGGTAYSPEVNNVTHEFNSLQEIFETALDQEIEVTRSINNIVTKCRKVQDFASESFLQWFVNEQMEEENTIPQDPRNVRPYGYRRDRP